MSHGASLFLEESAVKTLHRLPQPWVRCNNGARGIRALVVKFYGSLASVDNSDVGDESKCLAAAMYDRNSLIGAM
jgi:hypothetical protein